VAIITVTNAAVLAGTGTIGVGGTAFITNGLQVWYKFEDTTTTDSSGQNNTGTLTGSPLPILGAGKVGQGVVFSGGSGAVSIPPTAVSIPTSTSSFSITAWVKTTGGDGSPIFGGRKSGGSGILDLVVGYNGADNSLTGAPSIIMQGDNGIGQTHINGTSAINDGTFHHVATVFDGSGGAGNQTLKLYVDGAQVGSTATAPITSGISFDAAGANVGRENAQGWSLTGTVDDFRFYNRALLATEVNTIASLGEAVSTGAPLVLRAAARAPLSGAGNVNSRLASTFRLSAPLSGAGNVNSLLGKSYTLQAPLLGAGGLVASTGPPGQPGKLIPISNVFSEGLIDPDTGLPYGTWHGRGQTGVTFGRLMGIFAQFAGEGGCAVTTTWLQADFIWPGIVEDAGEQLLYRQAAGLEKSLASVDAYRLTQTYAELVRDQWDPYRISSTNLPYLAWAMGVNLWEDTWSEEFKRYWVANQWTMKYERGSALGLNDFVNTVNASPGMHAKIVNLVVPPACFYPGAALTSDERAAYVARFPQLRLYPYAPRPQLPYLGYLGGFSLTKGGQKIFVKNGHFLGPLLKYYPTNYNAGGDYLRSATLYEPRTGVETQLTVRTITAVPQPGQKEITYDEISLSSIPGNLFYPGHNKQYLLAKHPTTQKLKHAVVLGRLPYTPDRLVRVPRDGTLDRTQYQALFTTIGTGLDPINVRPEQVYQIHPMRPSEWYCGMPLRRTYLTKSNAWQFLYERWYLFDPTRLPDNRKASTYMGRARFGIHKYTAEADIQAWFTWPKFYARANGYYGKGRFFPPKNTKLIDQIRRAVTASMAARDTVLIDTGIKRQIQIRDLTVLDGRFSIGQYVTDRTA
jgi:phage tail P2-like protein